MLDELTSCLERIRSKIGTHRAGLRENEYRTRTVLIDPLLTVLGWDVTDPSRVTVEYTTDDGKRADYALRKSEGKPIAIIEAKKLDSPEIKNDAKSQLVNYSITDGVRFAILTDGDLWFVYDVFKPVALAEKELLKIKVSEGSIPQHALNFLLLWNSNLLTETPIQAKSPEVLYTTLEGINSSTDEVETGHRPGPVSPPPPEDWISLEDLYRKDPIGKPPSLIRFWDDSTEKIDSWMQVWTCVVEKCLDSGILDQKSLPLGWNEAFRVHTRREVKDGKPMKHSKYVDRHMVYIDTASLNGKNACARVQKLMSKLGKSEREIKFKLRTN